MSRIGKQLIQIPNNVESKLDKNSVMIKGPRGVLTLTIPPEILIAQDNRSITIKATNPQEHSQRALWGTIQRLIRNNIIGVTTGFIKQLKITGIGYRASMQNNQLLLEVGFSHPVVYRIPADINIQIEGNNKINISGIDKQKVGQVAAEIRAFKKPEPYKGKGICYHDEVVRRKAGKQTAGSSSSAGGNKAK